MFTASGAQDWYREAAGNPLHWPVDDYFREGRRQTSWLAEAVTKYHRTVSTYVDTLLDAGFRIARLVEPVPSEQALATHPEWADEVRRPMFLILSAVKPGGAGVTGGPADLAGRAVPATLHVTRLQSAREASIRGPVGGSHAAATRPAANMED